MAAKRTGGERGGESLRDHRRALDEALAALPPLVVAYGDGDFLRAEAARLFRAAWLEKYPGGDMATLRGAGESRQAGLADLTGELSGGSLFSREKLIVVRQAERILFPQAARRAAAEGEGEEEGESGSAGGREKLFLERLEKWPAAIWLFAESSQLPKNRILGKRLAAAACLIPCPRPNQRELPEWLAGRVAAMGKKVEDEALDLLIRAHGGELGVLAGELDKLALFAGANDMIDVGMAREFFAGTVEFDIFGLSNAVEARDRRQAVLYARRIALQGTRDQRGKREDGERSAHKAMSILAGSVQGMVRARIAMARRLEAAAFAAEEKLSPWRAARVMEAAGRFQLTELRRMLGDVAGQLRRMHDTGGDPLLALETMAVRLTSRGGAAGGEERGR